MTESEKKSVKETINPDLYHVRLSNQLSDSILNYFTMSVCLFFYGCNCAEILIIKEKNDENDKVVDKTLSLKINIIFISGIIQILLGIFDWYKGKSLTLLSNILFGILFVSWYIKYKESPNQNNIKNEKYEGIFYILFIVITLSMIIGAKNKGPLYSINYLALVVAFVFVVVYIYADVSWAEKVSGWAFIVCGGLFWITGLLRIINNQFLNKRFFFVKE
jgi:succinate-acetate transporter protein